VGIELRAAILLLFRSGFSLEREALAVASAVTRACRLKNFILPARDIRGVTKSGCSVSPQNTPQEKFPFGLSVMNYGRVPEPSGSFDQSSSREFSGSVA